MFHFQPIHFSLRGTNKVNDLAYVAGVAGNLATIPQAVTVWSGAAPGVSISSWIMYLIMGLVWLVYAIKNKQKPLIVAQVCGLAVNSSVVIGWLLHN